MPVPRAPRSTRSDIQADLVVFTARQPGGQDARDDIRAHVRAEVRQCAQSGSRVEVQSCFRCRHRHRLRDTGYERRHRQRLGINTQQDVEHCRISDRDSLINLSARYSGNTDQLVYQPVNGANDGSVQHIESVGLQHGVADTGDHIRAEGCLRI